MKTMKAICVAACIAQVLLAGAAPAVAAASQARIEELTEAMRQVKSDWTEEKTSNLLKRSDTRGQSSYTLDADDGRKVILTVVRAESILLDGADILAKERGPADGAPAASPRHALLPASVAVLGVLLVASVGLNIVLLRRTAGRRGFPRTEVIRSISRL
jgi:hypothetical protein